jgi:hypothetical protein
MAGLAWWTKYNGWLTLAITGAGTAGRLAWESLASRKRQRTVSTTDSGRPAEICVLKPVLAYTSRWFGTAAVAFLIWLPWLWQLQRYGGYAAVSKNHAGYFGGLSSWASNAIQQLAAQADYFGGMTGTAVLMAIVLMLGLCVFGEIWPATHLTQVRQLVHLRELSTWIALVWLFGLTAAVPLYRPYPRLALPWVLGMAVAIAGAILHFVGNIRETPGDQDSASLVERTRRTSDTAAVVQPALPPWIFWLLAPAIVFGVALWAVTGNSEQSPAWQDRTSLRTVASEVISRLKSERLDRYYEGYRCTIYVLAEPGLFFHLATAQPQSPIDHLAQAASDLGMAEPGAHRAGIPAFLLAGPHASQDELERSVAAGRLTPLAEFEYHPSDMVLLDEFPAWVLKKRAARPVPRIRLFHVKTD